MVTADSCTYTGRALLHANVLFNNIMGGTKQRSQVIILVTDGCATNKKSLKTTYDQDDGLLLVLSYYYTHCDRTQGLGVCARLWRASARCNRKYYVLGDTSRCPLVIDQ